MKSKREQRHASIIFKSGNPIAFGYNTGNDHAETNAINKASLLAGVTGKGATIVNIRITRGGKIALARPCPACYELLREKKFRKIIYSDNNGRFVEEYL
jgi:pyrimidine deaminase RibD-like protein